MSTIPKGMDRINRPIFKVGQRVSSERFPVTGGEIAIVGVITGIRRDKEYWVKITGWEPGFSIGSVDISKSHKFFERDLKLLEGNDCNK